MVRCGAHLSNLALGGSKVALRLFRIKVVQEAFESEVVSALKRVTDAEDEGRQTLTSASVTWFLTAESVRHEYGGRQKCPTRIRATDAVRVKRQTHPMVNRHGPKRSKVVDSVRRIRC
jgi:hypothetical protein